MLRYLLVFIVLFANALADDAINEKINKRKSKIRTEIETKTNTTEAESNTQESNTQKQSNTQDAPTTQTIDEQIMQNLLDTPKEQKTTAPKESKNRESKNTESKKTESKKTKITQKNDTNNSNRIFNKNIRDKALSINKNNIGYRSLVIQNIYKPEEEGVNFFIGLDFGANIAFLQYSYNELNNSILNTTAYGAASYGIKIGILSEEKYIGGRFYGAASYLKIPKFHIIEVGLNLDLLINYYRTQKLSLGLFLGLGGGMDIAIFNDKELHNSGKVPLSPIGWVNIGLFRFVYERHSFESALRYPYVFASIYKDSQTATDGTPQNKTTGYKFKSASLTFSYVYNF